LFSIAKLNISSKKTSKSNIIFPIIVNKYASKNNCEQINYKKEKTNS